MVWSEDPELPPTVVTGVGVEEVAKRVALEIDDALRAPFGFAGATEFLASRPVLTEQSSAAEIRQWLEDLDRSTPYPTWSMHDVPTDIGIGTANWYAKEHRMTSSSLEEQRAAVEQTARQSTNLEVVPGKERPRASSVASASGNPAVEAEPVGSRRLLIGVIEWSDQLGHEPSIMGSFDAREVTYAMAVSIHEELGNYPNIYRAEEFIAAHPGPEEWQGLRDAQHWLDEVNRELPFPRFHYREIKVSGQELQSEDQGVAVALSEHPQWCKQEGQSSATPGPDPFDHVKGMDSFDIASRSRVEMLLKDRADEFQAMVHIGNVGDPSGPAPDGSSSYELNPDPRRSHSPRQY